MTYRSNSISYIIPAYNCEKTLAEAVHSIADTNLNNDDEIVIVNDASTDKTLQLIKQLKHSIPQIKFYSHSENLGGGAARNTAVRKANNDFIFCLDSDNVLAPHSVEPLKILFKNLDCLVACFQEIRFFSSTTLEPTHSWKFDKPVYGIHDCFTTPQVPGASGNYLFLKQAWEKVGGYPEKYAAFDAWSFGIKLAAYGIKTYVLPNSFYYHRHGHESYWVRSSKSNKHQELLNDLIKEYLPHFTAQEQIYILQNKMTWFDKMSNKPLHYIDQPSYLMTQLSQITKMFL